MAIVNDAPAPVPRRRILRTGAALAATAVFGSGCTGGQPRPEPTRSDPDDALRDRVADGEREILDLYSAVMLRHPDLAPRLSSFTRRHEQHLRAMAGSDAAATTSTPSETTANPSPSGTSSVPVPTTGPAVPVPTPTAVPPPTPAAALAALREAERRLSHTQTTLCSAAAEPLLARLLASMSGCEGAHALLLQAGS